MPANNCRRDDRIRKIITLLPHCNYQYRQGTSKDTEIIEWMLFKNRLFSVEASPHRLPTNYESGEMHLYIREIWLSLPHPKRSNGITQQHRSALIWCYKGRHATFRLFIPKKILNLNFIMRKQSQSEYRTFYEAETL